MLEREGNTRVFVLDDEVIEHDAVDARRSMELMANEVWPRIDRAVHEPLLKVVGEIHEVAAVGETVVSVRRRDHAERTPEPCDTISWLSADHAVAAAIAAAAATRSANQTAAGHCPTRCVMTRA